MGLGVLCTLDHLSETDHAREMDMELREAGARSDVYEKKISNILKRPFVAFHEKSNFL
jgi:hypothetical protein